MVNIRAHTFETNSSSAHTVALVDRNDYTTTKDIERDLEKFGTITLDGLVYIGGFENSYRNEFEILDTWHDKLNYLVDSLGVESGGEIATVLKNYIPGCGGIVGRQPIYSIDEAYSALTYDTWLDRGANAPAYTEQFLQDCFGEVDHQSLDIMDKTIAALMSANNISRLEAIKEIIFSNRIVIIVESDADTVFESLLESGVFSPDTFKYILHSTYDDNYDLVSSEFRPTEEYIAELNRE